MSNRLGREPDTYTAVTEEPCVPRWKRVLDITLILLALPMILPVALLVIATIKWGSRGPLLFTQERIGWRGRPFKIYKFRTMVVNADTTTHSQHTQQLIQTDAPMIKMDAQRDPRLIPGGRWLRATGLDELAQLLNVLRGDMSLVGPRPCLEYEMKCYQPWHLERFDALPGLTGLWQVSGKNRTTFTEMMELDIYYARNVRLWLDLAILAWTIPALAVQVRDLRRKSPASLRRSRFGLGTLLLADER
jgi:lipopolysaccharide/colanic/teichoic acid biosynthesis glycosyltransferase